MDTFGFMGLMLAAGSMSYATAALMRVKKLEKRLDELESSNSDLRSEWKIESNVLSKLWKLIRIGA